MLYLLSEVFENVSVRRWLSKTQVTKRLNRAMFDSQATSLLSVEAAEHYSSQLNINIPAKDRLTSDIQEAVNEIQGLELVLCLGDELFCMFTPETYSKIDMPIDNADPFVKDPSFFVYSGYFDQPLVDFLTYDFQDQVELENTLVRNSKLDHTFFQMGTAKQAIATVTNSLQRLLRAGVVETNINREEYLIFKPNANGLETSWRSRFEFRLTGQPETGLFIPPCNVATFSPHQLLLFDERGV